MSIDETVSFSLEINVEQAAQDVRRLQTLAYRTLGILREGGILPKDIDEVVSKMQRAIGVANQLRLAMIALNAASGPMGWALAGVGLLGSVVSMGTFAADLAYDQTRTGR